MTQPATPASALPHKVRIWDLPTRLFHWLLAACIVALVITAKMGGNAMNWHLILGQVVLALLVFRILWGMVGGYWSRFGSFIPSPAALDAMCAAHRQRKTARVITRWVRFQSSQCSLF